MAEPLFVFLLMSVRPVSEKEWRAWFAFLGWSLKHIVYAVGKSCVTWKESLPHFGLSFLNVKWSSWIPWFLMSFPSSHHMIGWKESILASSLGFVSKKCIVLKNSFPAYKWLGETLPASGITEDNEGAHLWKRGDSYFPSLNVYARVYFIAQFF